MSEMDHHWTKSIAQPRVTEKAVECSNLHLGCSDWGHQYSCRLTPNRNVYFMRFIQETALLVRRLHNDISNIVKSNIVEDYIVAQSY